MPHSKRLLLINPSRRSAYGVLPPLGLGVIAALTPPSWRVTLVDENLRTADYDRVEADLVGITAMTLQANRAYRIARTFRARGIPVVLGGIHVSVLPDEALNHASSVVVGEAEHLWPEVVRDCEAGRLRPVYRADAFPDLGNAPVPRRDLFSRRYVADIIQTSRGCPFDCSFCSVTRFNGGHFRLRPVDEVVSELRGIRKRLVFFADDNIVGSGRANEERAMALFEAIIRGGIRKVWASQASVNVAENDELLGLMRRSGCRWLLIGFESMRPDQLREMGKRQNLSGGEPSATYRRVIRRLHDHGIAVHAFVCQSPSDDEQTVRATIDFVRTAGADFVNYPVLTPYPGTRFFEDAAGDLLYKDFPADWNRFDRSRLVVAPSGMTWERFYEMRRMLARVSNSPTRLLTRTVRALRYSDSLWTTAYVFVAGLYQLRLPWGDRRIINEELAADRSRRFDRTGR